MGQIINKLNLNNHPKEVNNNSLVYAKNIILSKDNNTITNENSITVSIVIAKLITFYGDNNFNITGIFPTNTELVIFSKYTGNNQNVKDKLPNINIFRFNEKDNTIRLFYNKITTVGDIKLAFNYNHLNQLIICFSIYNSSINEPIRTLNLGSFYYGYTNINDYIANENKTFLDDINICDKHLLYSHTPLCPELTIPKISDFDYIAGKTYKGIYNCFVRYKINNTNYTNWFNIGKPIYVDSLKRYNIIKYVYNHPYNTEGAPNVVIENKNRLGCSLGCSDYFSNDSDFSDNTFKLIIDDLDINFIGFQLGFVCLLKDTTKAFVTKDIYIDNKFYEYTLNIIDLIEHDVNDFIIKYNNYYNVQNLINYKNKIYFSNYKEDNINKEIVINKNDINIDIISNKYDKNNFFIKNRSKNGIFINADVNNNMQIDLNDYDRISIKDFFNLNNNKIKITGGVGDNTQYKYYAQLKVSLNYIYNKQQYVYTGYIKVYNNEGGQVNQTYRYDDQYLYKLDSNGSPVQKNEIGINFNQKIDGEIIKNIVYGSKNYYTYCSAHGNTDNVYVYNSNNQQLTFNSISVKYDKYLSKEIISGTIGNDYYLSDDDYIKIDNDTNKFIIHINGENYEDISINADGKNYTLNNDSFYCYYNNYINSNKVFDNIKENYLLPGNIYGFYIHFIDKYGNHTNGINIPFNTQFISDNITTIDITNLNLIYIPDEEKEEESYLKVLVINPINDLKVNYGYNIEYAIDYDYSNNIYSNIVKINNTNYEENISKCIEFLDKNFAMYENGTKWQDTHLPAYSVDKLYSKYITDENLNYYKIPVDDYLYKLNIRVNNIPQDYIGYFITADIYKTVKYKGIISLEDGGNYLDNVWTDDIASESNKLSNSNRNINNTTARFFSDELDINEELSADIKYGIIIKNSGFFDRDRYNFYLLNNSHYLTTLNKQIAPIIDSNPEAIKLKNVTFTEAFSNINNAFNIGSYISFDNNYNNNDINTCMLFTDKVNIKKNKTLIRISDVNYLTGDVLVYHDGYITTQGILIYNKNGVTLKDADKIIYSNTDQKYINKEGIFTNPTDIDKNNLYTPFVFYVQQLIIDDYLHESKQFKNEPETIIKSIYNKTNSEDNSININSYGCFVTPANSRDLFQRKFLSFKESNLITYDNYSKELIYSEEFNKTIRRSFQIKDESVSNDWRKIDNESYKNIAENKGNITNIIGLGNKFLIHTEHSLFQLDADNTLQTNNKDVLLEDKDIFDVQYKELFSTELGYGGLQDNKSWIAGSFGYIWYDSDSKHFYRLDNNTFDAIDKDIINFINKYNFTNVIFGNDVKNNRIIIQANYTASNTITISYNYIINNFISFHDYSFDQYINTKNNIYFEKSSKIYSINKNSYCEYPDKFNSTNIIKYPAIISFMFNNDYDNIKYIEYIKYRINYKSENESSIYSPVEEENIDYAGDYIRVYNNLVDTETIDITIDPVNKNNPDNSAKPYWELGYWNFNYLRNKIDNDDLSNISKSRIFGNFFVTEFTFNVNDYKFEFESFDVNYKLD